MLSLSLSLHHSSLKDKKPSIFSEDSKNVFLPFENKRNPSTNVDLKLTSYNFFEMSCFNTITHSSDNNLIKERKKSSIFDENISDI